MSMKAIAFAAGALTIIGRIRAIITWCVDKWVRISPVISPIIAQIENAALDGKITRDERKQIALRCVWILEERKAIRLNWFTRKVVNTLIDRIAGKLPDYKASQEARQLISEARLFIARHS